jgi:hypothetical protein
VIGRALPLVLAVLLPPLSGAAARAETARICGNQIDFPGPIRHFRLDESDPFGAGSVMTGALQQDGDRFLLRFNCWRLATPRATFPEERPAIERLFCHTRALGVFNQSYVYLPAPDRLFVRVSGERTVNGSVYEVRFEFHLLRDRTLGAIISHRRDSRAARQQADAFVDGLRSLR